MEKKMFYEDLIFLDKPLADANSFFEWIFPILEEKGFVKASFLDAIKAREEKYPTALPVDPPIALPHTDIEHIKKPFISVTRVDGTVSWAEMANNDHILNAKFVFLLGFLDKNGHVDLLQSLTGAFGNADFIEKLSHVSTPRECMELLETTVKL